MCSNTRLTLHRFSVLPAMSLQGMLYCDIVEGSFNSQSFYTFIKGLIASNTTNSFPLQNSVIVMDNCRIHKHPDILAAIEKA